MVWGLASVRMTAMEGVAEKQGARSPVCIVISNSPVHSLPELFPFIGRGRRKNGVPLCVN